jgi:acyl-CoA thioesterase FadM
MFPVWPPIEIPSNPFREAIFLCDKEGYDHLIAANTTLEFHKPLFMGDRLTTTTKFSKASTEKKSMLGTGFFLTALMVHTNQKGELICNQYFTVFKYKAPN